MFWLLLSLLVLLCVVALAITLLSLWRRVKVLGRSVASMSENAAQAQQQVKDAQVGGPLEIKPCPTCGTAVQARVLRDAAAQR